MQKMTDQQYLKSEQYNDAQKLNARIQLHRLFSTNPGGWYSWMLDQIALPDNARILELGCGSGEFWRANQGHIPAGWQVTLSDFSEGMLEKAQSNLAEIFPAYQFQLIDAQSIPFPDGQFDAVFANHMLYHVPDRPKALAEICRVLKDGGTLIATTTGERHLREIEELIHQFRTTLAEEFWPLKIDFNLENGQEQLSPFFPVVSVTRYPDSLHVTQVEPLADYMLSTTRMGTQHEQRPALLAFLQQEIDKGGGAIDITKDSGMFIAKK